MKIQHSTFNIQHICLLLVWWASPAAAQVTGLLTENEVNPQSVEALQPRFSWLLTVKGQNQQQTGYEILVSSEGKAVWGSGKTSSSASVYVPYGGPALQQGRLYQWKVRVWDGQDKPGAWSETALFRPAIKDTAWWKAHWITVGYTEEETRRPCPLFRKQFSMARKPVSAVAYITCHGLYEAQLNGKKIGNAYLTPGWTSYPKRLQYQVYDVTALLQNGANQLQVTLGDGWYRGNLGFEGKGSYYGSTVALLCQLELTYSDGTRETVVTDNSWQCTTGPIRYADIYNGVVVDARRQVDNWGPVKEVPGVLYNLAPTTSPLVTKKELFTPVKIWISPKGDTLADFGQNLVGWVQLQVTGSAGDSIQLFHGEVLDKNGELYTTNLRGARAKDVFVLKGGGTETLEPSFTFHGFRYIGIKGMRQLVQPAQLRACAIYSDLPQTGSFECSNPLINRLHQNILWTVNGNFVDVPTDCPQRDERMGWMGDAQLISRTAAFNRNVLTFYGKWLKDVAADQAANGAVSFVVPNILGEGAAGVPGWSDAATIVPWNLYEAYGDKRILEQQYASMKAWVDWMEKRTTGYLRNRSFSFGDWLSFNTEGAAEVNKSAVTDLSLISQAYYAYSVQLLVKAATVLGKGTDAARYSELLSHIKDVFVREYLTPGGRLVSETQTAYVLALHFDLLPEARRAAAAQKLAENIKSYDDHITTGILGTAYLCPVLTRFGYTDVAYKLLLQQTYPSWLYAVNRGATTIWERWDGIKPDSSFQHWHMNSFNHYALGSVGDWMYHSVAGIDMDSAGEGYKKIKIQPHIGGDLQYVKASLQTFYGKVAVHWQMVDGKVLMDVDIPPNASATIYVPRRDLITYDTVSTGSGHYHFESK